MLIGLGGGGGGGGGGHKPSGETSLSDTPSESVDALCVSQPLKNYNMVYTRYRQGMRLRRHEAKLSPSLVSRPHLSVAYHGTARPCLSLVISMGGI